MLRKKYYNYMKKRELIETKMEMLNIDTLILKYLKNMNLNTKNKNIIYIKNMVKKVLFDYQMYGKEKTMEIIDNYDYHIYSYSKTLSDHEIQIVKSKLDKSIDKMNLPCTSVNEENFKEFIITCADSIQNQIDNKNNKKLSLQC